MAPSIEFNNDLQSTHRFLLWIALVVFSTVCVGSVTSAIEDREPSENWVLGVCIVSLIVSFLSLCMCLLLKPAFVTQTPEMAMIVFLLVIWSAGLPIIHDFNRNIALSENRLNGGVFIINANLFFGSWLCLVCIILLLGSYVQERAGFNVRNCPPQAARWYGLCVASVVVLASAAQMLNSRDECEEDGYLHKHKYCKRMRVAIGFGCVSFLLSIIVIGLSHTSRLGMYIEFAVTFALLGLWGCGVGLLTFGVAPAATVSNLYFGIWVCFLLSTLLFLQNAKSYTAEHPVRKSGTSNNPPEAPVEKKAKKSKNKKPKQKEIQVVVVAEP